MREGQAERNMVEDENRYIDRCADGSIGQDESGCPYCEDGYVHDCGEDTCCCANPYPNVPCPHCNPNGEPLDDAGEGEG